MTPQGRVFAPAAVVYVLAILGCNVATNIFGLLTWGPLAFTAGTLGVGVALMARNVLQEAVRPRTWPVFALMLAGLVLSWHLASPALALASGAAFWLSELADWALYSRLRTAGRVRAMVLASSVGSVIDTVVFLWVAGFPLWPATWGQVVVKVAVCALAGAVMGVGRRAVLRESVNA